MKKWTLFCMTLCLVSMLSSCAVVKLPTLPATSTSSVAASSDTVSREANPLITAKNSNLISYAQAGGKVYTIEEIKKVYLPYSRHILMSRTIGIDEINAQLPMQFNRNNGEQYYTYYKTETGALYVFFDISGINCTMLYFSDTALDANAFSTIKAGTSTFEDVAAIDKNALLYEQVPSMLNAETPKVTQPTSEHILANGDLVEITYTMVDGKAVVESTNTLTGVAKTYTDRLLSIDQN